MSPRFTLLGEHPIRQGTTATATRLPVPSATRKLTRSIYVAEPYSVSVDAAYERWITRLRKHYSKPEHMVRAFALDIAPAALPHAEFLAPWAHQLRQHMPIAEHHWECFGEDRAELLHLVGKAMQSYYRSVGDALAVETVHALTQEVSSQYGSRHWSSAQRAWAEYRLPMQARRYLGAHLQGDVLRPVNTLLGTCTLFPRPSTPDTGTRFADAALDLGLALAVRDARARDPHDTHFSLVALDLDIALARESFAHAVNGSVFPAGRQLATLLGIETLILKYHDIPVTGAAFATYLHSAQLRFLADRHQRYIAHAEHSGMFPAFVRPDLAEALQTTTHHEFDFAITQRRIGRGRQAATIRTAPSVPNRLDTDRMHL